MSEMVERVTALRHPVGAALLSVGWCLAVPGLILMWLAHRVKGC